MSNLEILDLLKNKYINKDLVPIKEINLLLNNLFKNGHLNWQLNVSQPMTIPELEDLLSYNSINNQNKKNDLQENEEDAFHSFDLDDQQQNIKSLFDGWWGYERNKMNKVKNLAYTLEKKQIPINWYKIVSLSGSVLFVLSSWCYLEYKQIPF